MSYFKNTDLRKIAVLSVLVLAFIGCDNRDEVAPTLSIQQKEGSLRETNAVYAAAAYGENPEHCSILAVSGYMGFDCSDRFILDHKNTNGAPPGSTINMIPYTSFPATWVITAQPGSYWTIKSTDGAAPGTVYVILSFSSHPALWVETARTSSTVSIKNTIGEAPGVTYNILPGASYPALWVLTSQTSTTWSIRNTIGAASGTIYNIVPATSYPADWVLIQQTSTYWRIKKL